MRLWTTHFNLCTLASSFIECGCIWGDWLLCGSQYSSQPAAEALANLLEMQTLGPHSDPVHQMLWGWASNLCFNKSSRALLCPLKFANQLFLRWLIPFSFSFLIVYWFLIVIFKKPHKCDYLNTSLNVQFGIVKYIHVAVQQISRTSSCRTETLFPLNNSPFHHHLPTLQSLVTTILLCVPIWQC